jgi:hypothetical protein
MPMYWTGPFRCYCACGWKSDWKKSPVAAQFSGESHVQNNCCPFQRDAMRVLHGEKSAPMPDRSKYFEGGNFLKADDVKDGQIVVVEKFEEATTRLGVRPILRLKGIESPLGLNATNFDKMVEKYGDKESAWAGKKIKLVLVRANNPQTNKEQDAIRIA